MNGDAHMLDRLIALARENERQSMEVKSHEEQIVELEMALEKANERIAILESVELLAELKEISVDET